MMYWHNGMSGWGWLGMSVLMLIFWGLVIWGVVALVRYTNTPGTRETSSNPRRTTPDAILAERFARGEINDAEYAHKRVILLSADRVADDANIENTAREREVETVAR
ncbi:MAG: hypothetical protein NVS2B16_24720 [Chloroflexota bacterium]